MEEAAKPTALTPFVNKTGFIGLIKFISWRCMLCDNQITSQGPREGDEDGWALYCEVCGAESILTVIPTGCTLGVPR